MADVSRGVSTALGYVLNLGVATLLVTILLLSAGTLVEDQRDRAADTELDVVGERLAADLAAADRLARTNDPTAVRVEVDVPARVAGSYYTASVNENGNGNIVLRADQPDVEVVVPFETTTPVQASTVDGGDLAVVYDPGNDTLVVTDA
ncbi:DUF7266 family protein [Halobacterium jilantaiense]|uniref:Uncharacterized protein n=1 Tax=Halobacterium jilantaiense TaxID=355548 RepID=A0A1I0N5R0_9EURY|nr:hypothetical protein [Halobacterium jilantaiense]SEV96229.1 hypothetical protein SAMN04487945_0615 [Halobacterium jilantaiense]